MKLLNGRRKSRKLVEVLRLNFRVECRNLRFTVASPKTNLLTSIRTDETVLAIKIVVFEFENRQSFKRYIQISFRDRTVTVFVRHHQFCLLKKLDIGNFGLLMVEKMSDLCGMIFEISIFDLPYNGVTLAKIIYNFLEKLQSKIFIRMSYPWYVQIGDSLVSISLGLQNSYVLRGSYDFFFKFWAEVTLNIANFGSLTVYHKLNIVE